jgi:hypothetical protein
MTIDVVCPTCRSISYFEVLNRDAKAFCRVCDYPLFWASSGSTTGFSGEGDDEVGLRRLPGTAGFKEVPMLSCPVCDEPNPVTAKICHRCGADLHPAPTPVLVAPAPTQPTQSTPTPEPEPPPPTRLLWPWIVGIVVTAAAVFAIVAFLVWS